MAEIKNNRNASKRPIKIERQAFDALLITYATWQKLNGPSEI